MNAKIDTDQTVVDRHYIGGLEKFKEDADNEIVYTYISPETSIRYNYTGDREIFIEKVISIARKLRDERDEYDKDLKDSRRSFRELERDNRKHTDGLIKEHTRQIESLSSARYDDIQELKDIIGQETHRANTNKYISYVAGSVAIMLLIIVMYLISF